MLNYFFKRIFQSIIVVILIIITTFVLMNVIPGNAATAMMGEKTNIHIQERVVKELGLDKPVKERFVDYIKDISKGDLGKSIVMKRPVKDMIFEVFPNTLKLTATSLIFAWSFGILSGLVSAMYHNKFLDKMFSTVSILGISAPTFFIAIVLQYIFAFKLKLFPISGFGNFKQLVLPSIVLGWAMAGEISRLLRANLLENMESDFLDLARIKGRKDWAILIFHTLKISMLPVLTIMILQLASLLGGAMITESIFGIPGIGTLSISALNNRDLPVIQATVLLGSFLIILGNLVSDVLYFLIDPRIRLR
ncbi:ABC transporter permease [Peptoniphilus sp.]|mgnify:CR=1 FL=1|uniref:ABC transporter permease n=1 Tax=Peptoniphilus sp. TaxID=1971214 RepID=UPI003995A854